MNPTQRRLFHQGISVLILISMLFSSVAPVAYFSSSPFSVMAQESTEEPLDLTVEAPVEEPTQAELPTDAPPVETEPDVTETEAPLPEVTTEPVPETPVVPEVTEEPTAEVTEEPLPLPTTTTPEPVDTLFTEDFQSAQTHNWLLSGWELAVEHENVYLQSAAPGAIASVNGLAWENILLSAEIRLDDGDTAEVHFRAGTESYRVVLNSAGQTQLYRGETLLGESIAPVIDPEAPETDFIPTWHTLNIHALGDTLNVGVDQIVQITVTDPAAYIAPGAISFISGAANIGVVGLDNITIHKLDPVEITPLPTETVEQPTLEPEVTPDVEATEEATAEPEPEGETPIISTSFDDDTSAWLISEGAIIATEGETNNVLLLSDSQSIAPVDAFFMTNFRLDSLVNFVTTDPTGLNIRFHVQETSHYSLSFELGQIALSRFNDGEVTPLAAVPGEFALNQWHALSLTVENGVIQVVLNGEEVLHYVDEAPLLSGQFALSAEGPVRLMLDDIAVYDLTPAEALATETPLPVGLSEAESERLDPILHEIVQAAVIGDFDAITTLAAERNIEILDDALRIHVIVRAAQDETGASIAPFVEAVGGQIELVNETYISANLPIIGIQPLLNVPQIRAVIRPDVATSTSALAAPMQQGDNFVPHSLDIIGVNDWHLSNIRGQGATIAVIDTSAVSGTNFAAGTHGQTVVNMIRQVAPNATVRGYNATSYATLVARINAVRASHRIILITMDLGAGASPGDGTDGGVDGTSVYDAIQAAREAGVLVITSAGNNHGKYASFDYSAAGNNPVTFTVESDGPGTASISWNDWNPTASTNFSISVNGGAAVQRDSTTNYLTVGGTPAPRAHVALVAGINTITITQVQGGANDYIQFQTTGSITNSSVPLNTSSTIGRPGDSIHALTVGAVCGEPGSLGSLARYPLLPSSSRGPLYAAGGNQPPAIGSAANTYESIKPNIVAPSHVSIGNIEATTGCVNGEPTDGFNGTSAAAAHTAGMAALLIANPNPSTTIFNSGAGAADAITSYLSTHAIGLFAASSNNSYDNYHGAGLSTLGNPNFDMTTAIKPADLNLGVPTIYVGQTAPFGPQDGSYANPYVNPQQAINAAAPGDTIVFMPGEYVASFHVSTDNLTLRAYDAAGSATPSHIWASNGYMGNGAITVLANNVTLDGFNFLGANPRRLSGKIAPPSGVHFLGVNGGTVQNSRFSSFAGNVGIAVGTGIPEYMGNPGIQILNNIFENNRADFYDIADPLDPKRATAIRLVYSSEGPGTVIQNNVFRNNIGAESTTTEFKEAIIYIENSIADIYGNMFIDNQGESEISVSNGGIPPSYPGTVNIFSNLFIGSGVGGIKEATVYFENISWVVFINNTVTNYNYQRGGSGYLLRRSGDSSNNRWNIYNNLFYNNPRFLVADNVNGDLDCIGLNFYPVMNNWFFGTAINGGDCVNHYGNADNPLNNNIYIDPAPYLMGNSAPELGLLPNDPSFYRPIQGSPAIDAGDVSILSWLPDVPLYDVLGNDRISDGGLGNLPDIGAYELTPLTASDIAPPPFLEDTFGAQPAFVINLSDGVTGGYGTITYTISGRPTNYSTDPADFCGGAGLRQGTGAQSNLVYYCPPEHFYTSTSLAGVPDAIRFMYSASDSTSADPVSAEVILRINPVNDSPITAMPEYQFVAEAGDNFQLRLRPYVRFDNFRLSESGTGSVHEDEADYPFTYSNITIDDSINGYNPAILDYAGTVNTANLQAYIQSQITNPDSTGRFTLAARENQRGFIRFTYDVTDANSNTVTNSIVLEVVGIIPDRGLHDDTSFNFSYMGTGWEPIYSEANINNTLHRTRILNDSASFRFVGEGVVLYMQQIAAGAVFDVVLDGTTLQWQPQATNPLIQQATADGAICTTTATIQRGTTQLTNAGNQPYTISCRNLRDGQSHVIEVVNRLNGRFIQIDAVSILFEGAPLLPGIHDVNEPDMLPIFAGWDILAGRVYATASNQIAASTSNANATDPTFRFRGTGFAIGTALEQVQVTRGVFEGANYDICVTPFGTSEEVCENFDNSLGAVGANRPTFGVFRSFLGYDPTQEHTVRIRINSIPVGGRFIVDGIRIFDQQPTHILPFGVTEDDEIGPIIFANGRDDTWLFNTNAARSSNLSLTSARTNINRVGPIISFNIPADASTVHWYRSASARDSQNVRICVDRAQAETDTLQHCQTVDLRTAANPFVINEGDYLGGWDTDGTPDAYHTIEIFSNLNMDLSLDKVTVIDPSIPLGAGLYEEFELAATGSNTAYGFFDPSGTVNGGSFQTVIAGMARASGAAITRTDVAGDGVYFQMLGTGFSAYFRQDRLSSDVEICWLAGDHSAQDTLANGNCSTYENYSAAARLISGRSLFGLHDTPTLTSVAIRNVANGARVRMEFDAIRIYDEALPPNILTYDPSDGLNGTLYETSFIDRETEGMINYYGTRWRSIVGAAARAYSGLNYDQLLAEIGSGVVFRTQGADTLQISRFVHAGYAALSVCVDGVNCYSIAGNQQPAVVPLGNTGPHTISISTLTAANLHLDALTLYDSTQPLAEGTYNNDHALLDFEPAWLHVAGNAYSDRNARQTAVLNAEGRFYVEGSYIEVGMFGRVVQQTQICYAPGNVGIDDPSLDANCALYPAPGTVVRANVRQVHGISFGNLGDYTVRVRNMVAVPGQFDDVTVYNAIAPLSEGFYEETHPKLQTGLNGTWTTQAAATYSGRSALHTLTAGSSLVFDFTGTGFAVNTPLNNRQGMVEICYQPGALPSDINTINQNCYTYNNMAVRAHANTLRSINGLAHGTYSVRVRAVAPELLIDTVEIFNTPLVTITEGGWYNDNDLIGGTPAIQFAPSTRWNNFTNATANAYSGRSYTTVATNAGARSNAFAGAIASFAVQAPAQGATVILNTGAPLATKSQELQICLGAITSSNTNCSVVNMATTQYHQINIPANTTQVITLRTLTAGFFDVDDIQVFFGNVLSAGRYEDYLIGGTGPIETDGSGWNTLVNRAYTNQSLIQTAMAGDSLVFYVQGTGFEIASLVGRNGSEMEVCYEAGSNFASPADINENCYTYQNESARASNLITRPITGLDPNTVYGVRVRHLDDGLSAINGLARPVNIPAILQIDNIAVFNTPAPVITEAGSYNEDATDVNGDRYLMLTPTERWGQLTARLATGFSNLSYFTTVNAAGAKVATFGGTTASLNIQVPADGATLILNTGTRIAANIKEMQVCINGVCDSNLYNTAVDQFHVVHLSGPAGVYNVSFRALDAGFFSVDGFEITHGNILTAGRYEDNLMSENGLIETDGSGWTTVVNRAYTNHSIIQTNQAGDNLVFYVQGTGFEIASLVGRNGSEMLVCYEAGTSFASPSDIDANCYEFQNEVLRPSNLITRPITGLDPNTVYGVRVQHVDDGLSAINGLARPANLPAILQIDNIAVFDTGVAPIITAPGSYNEDATDVNGDRYLTLTPTERWGQLTARLATGFSNLSYFTTVNPAGAKIATFGGTTASLNIQVPADGATLILNTGTRIAANIKEMQVCINGVCDSNLYNTAVDQFHVVHLSGPAGVYNVSFRALDAGFFSVDGFEITHGNILTAGRYEDNLMSENGLIETDGSGWTTVVNRAYTNHSIIQTNQAGDNLVFYVQGTGFEIASLVGRNGSEMLVCYEAGTSFASPSDIDANCYEFQNEVLRPSNLITRPITGLDPNTVYGVRVQHVDDGLSAINGLARPANLPAILQIDNIAVFDTGVAPIITAPGSYNEDATDVNGDRYLTLTPTERWGQLTARLATGFSNLSYFTTVNPAGAKIATFGGTTASLNIQVPADGATLVLNTGTRIAANIKEMEVCIGLITDANCSTIYNTAVDQFHAVTLPSGAPGVYTVTFRALDAGFFSVDGFELIHGTVLTEGRYEDSLFGDASNSLIRTIGTGWTTLRNNAYSDRSAAQTNVVGDGLTFYVQGTGFEITSFVGPTNGEMRVCYEEGSSFADPTTIDAYCYEFPNEVARASRTVTRSINGLDPNTVYGVYVEHVNDEVTFNGRPRPTDNRILLQIDNIAVFNNPPAVITEAGFYNEDAADINGTSYLAVNAPERWGSFSGAAARNFTESSYLTVVDAAGRKSAVYGGASAVLQIEVPAEGATVVLNTGAVNRSNTTELQACIYVMSESTSHCIETYNTATSQYHVISFPPNEPGTHYLMLQSLTPGFLTIDSYEVIFGSVLQAGMYDDFLMQVMEDEDDTKMIGLLGNWQLPPTAGTALAAAYGRTLVRTQDPDAELRFAFEGTGFIIFTRRDARALDLEICYVHDDQYQIDGFDSATCADDTAYLLRGAEHQSGLAYYGLPANTYHVAVRVKDDTIGRADFLYIDAIGILGDVTAGTALQPGIYDDVDLLGHSAVEFAPSALWAQPAAAPRVGPPTGPWQKTEIGTTQRGAVLQTYVEGNTLILYQSVIPQSSTNVRVCLAIPDSLTSNELACSEFSQSGPRSMFSPIAFYGLGDGTHQIIFENQMHGRRFNVDAIQVVP